MKNSIISLAILLFALLSSCSKDTIVGSGELTSEIRNVEYFTKVSSEGVFEVNVTQGSSQSLEIIANDNIIHQVKTEVVNDELHLYLDNNNDSYEHIRIRANIVATRLNGLKNSGVGDIYAYNIIEDGHFSLKNSGTADIMIEGITSSLSVKNEGTGNIHGFDFLVNDGEVEIQGSGEVEINCADYLNVEITGSGNIYYKGQPAIDASISGSGKVINSN